MPIEGTPNSGNEELPEEQPQESFEDYQKRMKAKEGKKEEGGKFKFRPMTPGEREFFLGIMDQATGEALAKRNLMIFDGFESVDPRASNEKQTQDILADYLERHPNPPIPEIIRGQPERIRELDEVLAKFENKHSIEDLTSISVLSPHLGYLMLNSRDMIAEGRSKEIDLWLENLPPEDAEKYRIREAARSDLDLITHLLGALENMGGASPEELKRLKDERRRFSRAVGMMNINDNTIDHSR